MDGVLAYLLTVLVRLPGGQGEAPTLSVLIAGVLTIAAFVEVLMAMRHAVGSLSPHAVVRDLAEHALDQLRRPKWPDDPRPRTLVDGSLETVRAEGMGWVSSIDHDELLALMPEGATLVLHVDLGDVVAAGDRLLSPSSSSWMSSTRACPGGSRRRSGGGSDRRPHAGADEVDDEASAAVLAEERQRLAASTSDAGHHVARS